MSADEQEEGVRAGLSNIQMNALTSELKRFMTEGMEDLHARLDRIQMDQQADQTSGSKRRNNNRKGSRDDGGSSSDQRQPRRQQTLTRDRDNPFAGEHRRSDNHLGGLKLKIPPFHGKNDPDAFLEWERKVELVFDCQQLSDRKKVRLAATEFNGYALNWWDQLVTNRRRQGEEPLEDWDELLTLMRKRFVPNHYLRDLHQKLRRLTQGTKSVDDYYQEMEILMLRGDVDEDPEATMARFLSGLNREIQDRMELQDYDDLAEMLHKAILVEQQVKRKGFTRPSYQSSSKPNPQDKGKSLFRTNTDSKTNPVVAVDKTKQEATPN